MDLDDLEDDQVLAKEMASLQKNVTYVKRMVTSVRIARLIKGSKKRSGEEREFTASSRTSAE